MIIEWFKKTLNIVERADLYEMSNIPSKRTGLPVTVFCSPKGAAKHECRVKVSNIAGGVNEHDVFSIDLSDLIVRGHCKLSSDDLEAVKWWIHRNRFVILDFWKERIDTLDFLQSIKPISE
jgi:hypothetical protein